MEVIDVIKNVGSELTGTAGATAKLDFSAASVYDADFVRKGVLIANCGVASLYVKLVTRGAAAPTVTSSNFHAQIAAGAGPLVIRCRRSVDLYIFGTDKYAALEVG